jgi:hypothetical protein
MDATTMRVTVEQGELRIDAEELIRSLPPEEQKKIAKLIGADEEAWRQMAEALVDPNGLFNNEGLELPWYLSDRAVLAVREKLVPLMPEVAQHTISELQRLLDKAQKRSLQLHDWAWAMYHAHHHPDQRPFPRQPDWAPAAREEMRIRDAAPAMLEALRAFRSSITFGGSEDGFSAWFEHPDDGPMLHDLLDVALRAAESPEGRPEALPAPAPLSPEAAGAGLKVAESWLLACALGVWMAHNSGGPLDARVSAHQALAAAVERYGRAVDADDAATRRDARMVGP